MMRDQPWRRLYRVLLRAFPAAMRDDMGEEMAALFAQQMHRARGLGRLRLLTRAIADALRHGSAERLRERRRNSSRHDRSTPRRPRKERRWWMDTLEHDLRYAWRGLRRQPAIAAAILLTLALGIGANTAVFSVVHAVLLRPLPYSDPGQLVIVWEQRPAEGADANVVSPADFLDWARLNQSFTGMAAFLPTTGDLTGTGDAVQIPVGGVTAAFFDVLGVRPALGRTFTAGDDVLGNHRVVVLSDTLWRQRFGSDPSVIGRTITLNGLPQQVIGVLPANFEFSANRADARMMDVSGALVWAPIVLQGGSTPPPRASHQFNVYARLKPGVSLQMARDDMRRLGDDLSQQYRENAGHAPNVVPLRDDIVKPARDGLLVVMSAVGFLLLIACTNVANLLLARSAGRRRELAIRSAIGGERGRLLRQSLTESLLISLLGGALGLIVAAWTLQLLIAETPAALRGVGLVRARLDAPVLLFTAAVAVVTALVAGALPAWQVARTMPGDPLREAGRSPLTLRRGVRVTLIASEVALTVVLLIGAGLMLRSFIRVLAQPPGIDTANRVVLNLSLPRSRYPTPDAVRAARRQLDERFLSVAGVIAAGSNNNLPFTGSDSRQGITVEGYERRDNESPVRAHIRIVTPGYFGAAGIAVHEGRTFAPADDQRAPLVVVVNDTMARRYWPNQSPVGKRVRFNGDKEPWWEVVGVIADVKHWGLDQEINPELYLPHEQLPSSTLTYVVHTSGEPLALVPALTAQVAAVDRDLPTGSVRSYDAIVARATAPRRWSALLLGMFAGLGLLLAAAGIYGVMTHLVSLRTSEIAIRLTLGARPRAVMRQVVGEALLNTSVGLAVGIVAGVGLTRLLQSMLYDVAPLDPAAFVLAAVVVVVVAAAAALGPAARAMRIDPVRTLRGA